MNALGAMRFDMRLYSDTEEIDAVVIGTGAGGAPILAKLAAAGFRVLGLEAGKWFSSPAEDFATDEIAASKIYWLDERLSGGKTPVVFGANNSGYRSRRKYLALGSIRTACRSQGFSIVY